MADYLEKINEASEYLRKNYPFEPEVGLILGSGLGELADEMNAVHKVDFGEIPHFPVSTIAGHSGVMVLGELEGKKVLALKGRIHYYEGYSMPEVTFPVRIMQKLNVKSLIVTNACGGINVNYNAGDLMLINDHINYMPENPLRGHNFDELGVRFPDMSKAYHPDYVKLALECAKEENIPLQNGVYLGLQGPNYETKAEINFFRVIGADAVGMSTVHEVIVAVHAGIKVLGISCVTDVIYGGHQEGVCHEHVLAVANKMKPTFKKLVRAILKKM